MSARARLSNAETVATCLTAALVLAAGCARASGRLPSAVGSMGEHLAPLASLMASRADRAPASSEATRSVAAIQLPTIDVSRWRGAPFRRAMSKTDAVAITIDDGPSRNTAEVLGIFEREGARATFFFVGNRSPRYRTLVRRAAAAGFEIGDHTWGHDELRGLTREQVLAEVDRAQAELGSDAGVSPVLVRPAAGHWDETALAAINERGLVLALWSLHGQDTGPGTHAETIAKDVIASARGGDVILLHETNPETVKALPSIIAGLRAKGLRPVTMSELMTP